MVFPKKRDAIIIIKRDCTTYNDIVHIVFLDLTSKVNVDLNSILGVMFLDSVQERGKPFRSAVVTNDPSKVYLPDVYGSLVVRVSESIW